MINLNNYRKNIYHNEGFNECPHYSEDGIILKIFEEIGVNKLPTVIEFGEHRTLGTTTRAFRIKYLSKAIYFAGNLGLYSKTFNVIDIIKIVLNYKNPKYLKFLFNQPFKYFVTPENFIDLLDKSKVGNIDICCIDIDSYDFFIAKKILNSPKNVNLYIVEYNPNLPLDKSLTLPHPPEKLKKQNKRIYGASFKAMNDLFTKHNYKLIHISGYCNLFYIKNEYGKNFKTPNYLNEIPQTDQEVNLFTQKYGMKNFVPSWTGEKYLTENDLVDFIEI